MKIDNVGFMLYRKFRFAKVTFAGHLARYELRFTREVSDAMSELALQDRGEKLTTPMANEQTSLVGQPMEELTRHNSVDDFNGTDPAKFMPWLNPPPPQPRRPRD